DVAARAGADVVRVDVEWGAPVEAERLLNAHPNPTAIAMVHAETSTGVLSPLDEIGANKGDALFIVDCVTSLGGTPVEVDANAVDLAYSGTQKCLGVAPGLAPLTVSDRAIERLKPKPQSWYLDLNMIAAYVTGSGARAYHHTAPISMIFSIHAGLGALLDEGLDQAIERHQRCGRMLQDGLEKMGFELFAAEGYRLPQLTSVVIPEGRFGSLSEAAARRILLDRYGLEVGGGLGDYAGKIWRIGCMGHTARERNVALLLAAIEELSA
ncbi:MAG: aminotransferase class V-fold PLP-dependent enzyme, partial [Acidimicrobiia bacterium]|nr:aminotransferase class V-fold PLP-dependent enzyme [Acidimicrobiia bacterium]